LPIDFAGIFHLDWPIFSPMQQSLLVRKGEVGYVRDIGTFLQQFYIYAVEWIESGTLVGMRGKELASLDLVPATPEVKESER
jgi:nitrogen fixation protein NifZ